MYVKLMTHQLLSEVVSANIGGSPGMTNGIKVETHNIVAAVQKLLQGDLVSLVLPYNRRWRTVGLL